MAISDRIESMYTHVGEAYDSIDGLGVNVGRNRLNIVLDPSELEQATTTGKNKINTNTFTNLGGTTISV